MREIKNILKKITCIILLLLATVFLHAQPPVKVYKVKEGNMFIMLSKNITAASLDSFIADFELQDLNLKKAVIDKKPDSLVKTGWKIEIDNDEIIALSKKMGSIDNINNPAVSIAINGNNNNNNTPFAGSTVKFGINKFRNKRLFAINDSIVTFYLRGNTSAGRVILAGSFNNWNEKDLQMNKTDDGWTADVKLAPGKYWYKFIIDGNWDIDRDNRLVENDGKGNDNSVYYKPNYIFRSHAFNNSKEVFVAGSFNNWKEKEIPMARTANGWAAAIYLADGTYTYRFIADGNWSEDPENPDHFPNEFGEYNSVIRLGRQQVFKLDGFETALKVTLIGSFNNWRDDELQMKKVNGAWELSYAIGPGNYEYTCKVDGKWITGIPPAITLTNDANKANYNNLIIEPNYTFRLKGYDNAVNIFLAGDFNNWSPNTYRMTRSDDGWTIDLHIDKGKHTYKFIVDGKWILDPGNKLWEQNEFGTGNSILWKE